MSALIPPDMRQGPVAAQIRRQRLIVALRRVELLTHADELAGAGARIFEVAMDGDAGARDLIATAEQLARRGDGIYVVGAGNVRTSKQLRAALDARSAFAAGPTLNPSLIGEALDAELPFIPGAATPSEAELAWSSGATFIQLFPATSLGPSFVRELRGPMPEIEMIPTGGITFDNARAFLDAGATAIRMESVAMLGDAALWRSFIESLVDKGPPRSI
jgi:2-dehydro-3-deoxyphosphogluconate aldolase/(4S)-4-hydroxy-2-oxoglutarate aldolase